MRSLIQLYALAVCFTTLMCFMIALGIGLHDLVQIAAPGFTLNQSGPHQSNDLYLQYYPAKVDSADDEVSRLRLQALAEALHAERRGAQQSGLFVLIVLVIDAVVFGLHWRIARGERAAPLTPPPGSDTNDSVAAASHLSG